MTPVELPKDPNYNFMTDMTDQAISWMGAQKSLTPDKPFFLYFAPGATHAPHHVPKEWIAKYKGKFDQGWEDRKSTRLNSSHGYISYAVFCLKKKTRPTLFEPQRVQNLSTRCAIAS